jgi:hypothetical protein
MKSKRSINSINALSINKQNVEKNLGFFKKIQFNDHDKEEIELNFEPELKKNKNYRKKKQVCKRKDL